MRSFASILVASGFVQLASTAACKPHFCRNAILGAPAGIDDCNAFLLTTVIMPSVTAYSTPSSVITKTHTRTISETETDSYTSEFQPTSAIWSTYTSIDVINSVTVTTKKLVTTTTSPKITQTTTTALATTTLTSTTMTTTKKNSYKVRREDGDDTPQPQTITNSIVPEYASACSYAHVYTSNCLNLGAVATVTTIVPPVDSIVLSSTLISTASADSSVYVSTTITQTTIKTLSSLHSTTTVVSTTTDVISTETSTLYTETATQTSFGVKVSTLATTTTTTTLATASPTPYNLKVSDYPSGYSSLKNSYLDSVVQANFQALSKNGYTATYAIGFTSSGSASNFVITPQGLAVIIKSQSGGKTVNTPYYLTVDSNGYVVPNSAPSATDNVITCSTPAGRTPTLSCNYYFGAKKFTYGSSSLTILTASTSDIGFDYSVLTSSY